MTHIIDSRGLDNVSSGFLPITMIHIDKMTSIAKYLIELVMNAKFLLEVHYQICIVSQTYIESIVHGHLFKGDKAPDSQSRKGAEKTSSLIISFHRWGN